MAAVGQQPNLSSQTLTSSLDNLLSGSMHVECVVSPHHVECMVSPFVVPPFAARLEISGPRSPSTSLGAQKTASRTTGGFLLAEELMASP